MPTEIRMKLRDGKIAKVFVTVELEGEGDPTAEPDDLRAVNLCNLLSGGLVSAAYEILERVEFIGVSPASKPTEGNRIAALMLDVDELGAVFSACDMVASGASGEGPYLDAARRVIDRLRPYTLLGKKGAQQS